MTWPAGPATLRTQQFAYINNSIVNRGLQGMQWLAGDGAKTITGGFVEQLAAGGTVQAGIVSSAIFNAVAPNAFALTRLG